MVHETKYIYVCCLYELCHCVYICCVSTYVYAHQLHMFYSTCLPMYINVCAVLCVYVQNKPYSAYHSYIHIHTCVRSFVRNTTYQQLAKLLIGNFFNFIEMYSTLIQTETDGFQK